MGSSITLNASDGHSFSAYRSMPDTPAKGGVVIIQEIFGVNQHIQEVVDGYASRGYAAIAPALFDRIEPEVELDYDQEGINKGLELARQKLKVEHALADISATVASISTHGPVATIGYCFGGFLAYLSAANLDQLACAIAYYGGGITNVLDQLPRKPIMFHFAEHDHSIPLESVEEVRAACPDSPLYVYSADHGFNCNLRAAWNADAAELALARTIKFLEQNFS